MSAELFWSLALVVGFIAPLLLAGLFVEVLAPRSRSWIKRLRRIEAGRKAMRGPA